MKLSDTHLAARAVAPAAAAATAVTGSSIAMQNWDNVTFCILFGATVDAVVEVQVSDDDSTWLTVTGKSVAAVALTPTIVNCGRLDRAYARVRITPATATDVEGGIALLSCSLSSQLPPANASVLDVFHNPPAA